MIKKGFPIQIIQVQKILLVIKDKSDWISSIKFRIDEIAIYEDLLNLHSDILGYSGTLS